ncbi:MAG: hypothetical protein V4722_01430 [Bacteroidota bacterium]
MYYLLFQADVFGAKEYIAVGAAIVGLATLIKGIFEYSRAQRWKKAEFISKEVKEFYASAVVVRALKILDWDSNWIQLNKGEIGNAVTLDFDSDMILKSLRHHDEVPDGFSPEEEKIREIIDGLLDKLSLFQHYIEGGLFSANELKGYLKYWTDIMFDENNERKNKGDFRKVLKKYIHTYKFYDLIKLAKGLGYNFS